MSAATKTYRIRETKRSAENAFEETTRKAPARLFENCVFLNHTSHQKTHLNLCSCKQIKKQAHAYTVQCSMDTFGIHTSINDKTLI